MEAWGLQKQDVNLSMRILKSYSHLDVHSVSKEFSRRHKVFRQVSFIVFASLLCWIIPNREGVHRPGTLRIALHKMPIIPWKVQKLLQLLPVCRTRPVFESRNPYLGPCGPLGHPQHDQDISQMT